MAAVKSMISTENRFNMIARWFGDEKVKSMAVDVRWKLYMLFQIKTLKNLF